MKWPINPKETIVLARFYGGKAPRNLCQMGHPGVILATCWGSWGQLGAKMGQLGAKKAKDPPKKATKINFEQILDNFLDKFWDSSCPFCLVSCFRRVPDLMLLALSHKYPNNNTHTSDN